MNYFSALRRGREENDAQKAEVLQPSFFFTSLKSLKQLRLYTEFRTY